MSTSGAPEPLKDIRGAADCRKLLAAAFPDLAPRTVTFLGEGWDNTVFLLDERIVVRFPRHARADRQLRREVALLRLVGPTLPVPTPQYRYAAGPVAGFERSVAVYPLLPGQPLTEDMPLAIERSAERLANFLSALWSTPVNGLPAGTPNYSPATWFTRHDQLVAATLPGLQRNDPALATRISNWWEASRADPCATDFTPALIHGDLAPEHLLIDEQGVLSGVIDFGDAMVGDPALDLAGLPDALFEATIARLQLGDTVGLRRRRDTYQHLAPLHALEGAARLARPELLREGMTALRLRFGE